MRTHWRTVLLSAALLTYFSSLVSAQEQTPLLSLPQLQQCRSTSRPLLPEKWQATFLMAPFSKGQLVLSRIVYDASLPAMRVTLYGVRRGSQDYFISDDRTYALQSDGGAVTQCRDLGDTDWQPLPRDWLAPQSQCVGSAPIGETAVDWWKTPIEPAPASYWIWYKASDGTPFRLVFPARGDQLGIFSEYAVSHQVAFEPLSQTNLGAIANACRGAPPADSRRSLRERLDAMAQAPERADREIAALMPELAACPADPLPTWPGKLALTGLMTPADASEDPYPTEVLYDWSVPGQRTRVFFPSGSGFAAQDALLVGPRGYNVIYHRQGGPGPTCVPVLPGAIRPEWAARAPCSCEAMITGRTALTPYGAARILACPLAVPRAAWAWYTLDGRPMSFLVTSLPGDQGLGLFAVLDYRDWLPGHAFPASVFDRPGQCQAPPPRAGMRGAAGPPASCSACHLGGADGERR